MSDEKIDKILQDFLESVTAVLRQHAAALERLQQNQQIDHLNMTEIAGQVNAHRQILVDLDIEIRQRMGEPPVEPPREPVN